MPVPSSSTLPSTASPFLWERQTRAAFDAIVVPAGSPVRALLIGNAGSGKSCTLRRLQSLLAEQGRRAVLTAPGAREVAASPASDVLIVDDVHLAEADAIDALRARVDDPLAGLVLAGRPWPRSERLTQLLRRMEQSRSAIVLGHLSRSDILAWLDAHGQVLPEPCLDYILEASGGVSWMVHEALQAHDERDCDGDDGHRALRDVLCQRIAHRLDTIDPLLRGTIEQVSIAPPGHASADLDGPHDWALQGFSEGLLSRNGHPLPIVRSAVYTTIPVGRLAELSAEVAAEIASLTIDAGSDAGRWVGLVHDQRVAEALVEHADRMLHVHPARASELYRGAMDAGADPAAIAVRRAEAAWAMGDIDAAGAIVDETPLDQPGGTPSALTDISAAVWAARGMMEHADAVYRVTPPRGADQSTRAFVAAIAVGDAAAEEISAAGTAPTALGVALHLLHRGLTASLGTEPSEAMLADLVRSSEMYTTSRTSAAIPELPAVIAVIAALNIGGVGTASVVLEEAISGEHGGPWARARLLLWRAWIAVQRGNPSDARAALASAEELVSPLSARDELLAQAVRVAIARRYEDAPGLEAAWHRARGAILRTDIDLFLLHPLAEFISSASRVGDAERLQPHFARAMAICAALDDPPLWSSHLQWAGIQRGILLNQPSELAPYAQALVAASSRSRVAALMARAGRVWTSVLGGTVDADAVEAAATGLASIGLVWDGARLAGHGAGRTADRKVAARLLACARELHPTDSARRHGAGTDGPDAPGDAEQPAAQDVLSERELEVARLVLQGKTYAEIGEAIFISPRTAEHHIAHIRRRLGATSRSEVIAKLRMLLQGEESR